MGHRHGIGTDIPYKPILCYHVTAVQSPPDALDLLSSAQSPLTEVADPRGFKAQQQELKEIRVVENAGQKSWSDSPEVQPGLIDCI